MAFVTRVAGFLVLCALLFAPMERLWPRTVVRVSWREWLIDVLWLVAGALTLNVVVGPVLHVARSALHQPLPSSPLIWALTLLFAEVLSYASHRAMHEVRWLAKFHAVHHHPRELDFLKAFRVHPVDVAVHAFAVALPGLLLGASLSSMATLVLLRRLYTAFLHANVSLRFGALEHLLATPAFHHQHHVGRGNYAGTFPWLDRLFGTLAPH